MDKTLLKGLQVLEAVARSSRPRGVSELAAELDLTRSNAHRTLRTLVESGFVQQDERSGNYECTLKLFELGSAAPCRADISSLADPIMLALSDSIGETVHLSALDNGDVVYLHKIDSTQPVRAYTSIGGRAPAYCVATGKALLAFQPESYADCYAGRLQIFTPNTLQTIGALRDQLRQIRRQGFAVNNGEWRDSVCGVAAPVFGLGDRAIAAIGISGPASRMSPVRLYDLSGEIVAAARELTRRLGRKVATERSSAYSE